MPLSSPVVIPEDLDVDSLTFGDESTQINAGLTNQTLGHIVSLGSLKTFDLSTQDVSPTAVYFRADGLKMYFTGTGVDNIHEFDLTVAWDIDTLVFVATFVTVGDDNFMNGLEFKFDGTKFYLTGNNTNVILEYDLSVAWDITSAVLLGSLDVSPQDDRPSSMMFKPGGARFYLNGTRNNLLYQYNTVTAWSVIGATFSGITFDPAGFPVNLQSSFFSADGAILQCVNRLDATIFEYVLPEPWNLTTAKLVGNGLPLAATDPRGNFISPYKHKLYFVDSVTSLLTEQDIGIETANVVALDVVSDNVAANGALTLGDESTQINAGLTNQTLGHLSTAVINQTFSASVNNISPQASYFRVDGLKMYLADSTVDGISEYDLSSAWNISTAAFVATRVITEDLSVTGVFFKFDGRVLYVVGNDNDNVYEYALSNPWDVTSATFTVSFDISSEEISPRGIVFHSAGTRFYVAGNEVFEYDAPTPWSIAGANFSGKSFSPTPNPTVINGFAIASDGQQMYIISAADDDLSEFVLTTPWDITTAVFRGALPLAIDNPGGPFISPFKHKMFHVDTTTALISEYDIGIDTKGLINGVPLTAGGSVALFLNQAGVYTIAPGVAESLATTLSVANVTGGSDIVITNGDVIIGAPGTTGATIFILGGFGDNVAGGVVIAAGLTDNGQGADVTTTAGPGGTEGGTAPGGNIIDTSGSGNSNNQPSGDLHYKSGNPDGSGAFGDMFLMEDGGKIGVGNVPVPKANVHLLTSGVTGLGANPNDKGMVITGNSGFCRLYFESPSANSGERVFSIGHEGSGWEINAFTDNGGGVVKSNILTAQHSGEIGISVANPDPSAFLEIGGTTKGWLQPRLTEDNKDAIASPASGLSLHSTGTRRPQFFDDLDGAGSAWQGISVTSSFEFEIFIAADLDLIDAGDVITVDGISLVITLKADITSNKRFNVINGGRLSIKFSAGFVAWAYSGTGTFYTSTNGGLEVEDGQLFGNSSATLFDVTANSNVAFNSMTVVFWGSYGTIKETSFVLMVNNGFFVGNGTLDLIDNAIVSISNWGLSSGTAVSGALVRVSGQATGFFDWSSSNVTLQSGESFIRFDPFAPILSATIANVRAVGGELFDTAGSTGAFSATADVSIAPTAVTSVGTDGGSAEFFHSGTDPSIGEQAILTGFVESTYNVVGEVTAVDAGFSFTVGSITFAGGDTGSFETKTIAVTAAAHGLSNGQTLRLFTTLSTNYNEGYKIFNVAGGSFECSDTFVAPSQTGTWNTSGLDQSDPRVLANNNPGFVASEYIAASQVNNNAFDIPGGSITNNTFRDMLFGEAGNALVIGSTMERFTLTGELNGEHTYTGNEPFDASLPWHFFSSSTGGTVKFRYKWLIDPDGGGFVDFTDVREIAVEIGSTGAGIGGSQPMLLKDGDKIKPVFTRNTGSSDFLTEYAQIG